MIKFIQQQVKKSEKIVKIIFKTRSSEGTTLQSVQMQSRIGLELVAMVTGSIRRISNKQPTERAKDSHENKS